MSEGCKEEVVKLKAQIGYLKERDKKRAEDIDDIKVDVKNIQITEMEMWGKLSNLMEKVDELIALSKKMIYGTVAVFLMFFIWILQRIMLGEL